MDDEAGLYFIRVLRYRLKSTIAMHGEYSSYSGASCSPSELITPFFNGPPVANSLGGDKLRAMCETADGREAVSALSPGGQRHDIYYAYLFVHNQSIYLLHMSKMSFLIRLFPRNLTIAVSFPPQSGLTPGYLAADLIRSGNHNIDILTSTSRLLLTWRSNGKYCPDECAIFTIPQAG